MIDVGCVIVTRNTRALTCEAIQSILESQDTLRKTVVVVDNGSTDDTAACIARDFPSVICLRSESNLGFARANNRGALQAPADFILLLNSDARLQPQSLRLAVDWMRSQPQCGICGAQLLNADGSLQNSIANYPSLATELLNKSLLRFLFPRRFPGKEHHFTHPVEVESVIGAFMLIRGSLWRALDGLDERYFFFLEETDFCRQAKRQGWNVVHLPQVQVWHGQGKSARQVPIGARIEYWRSRYAYFAKHRSRLTCEVLRAGLLLRLTANSFSSCLFTLVTLGRSDRWRHAWKLNKALWSWHWRGRPAEDGLPR